MSTFQCCECDALSCLVRGTPTLSNLSGVIFFAPSNSWSVRSAQRWRQNEKRRKKSFKNLCVGKWSIFVWKISKPSCFWAMPCANTYSERNTRCQNGGNKKRVRTWKQMTLSGFIVVRASAFDYCRCRRCFWCNIHVPARETLSMWRRRMLYNNAICTKLWEEMYKFLCSQAAKRNAENMSSAFWCRRHKRMALHRKLN